MRDHGYALSLASTAQAAGHHDLRLLGAREQRYENEPVLELLYECCGEPVRLIVAKVGGAAAKQLTAGVAMGQVQASRQVGEYVAAVVGRHRMDGLIRAVEG